jgi:predicted MFS family arabinose efflux permease
VGLLRNRAFAVFWLARTISFAGTGITVVVLPVLAYRLTHSPGAVASLNALEAMPYLAFGLVAGAMADRLNRKKMMVTCDLAAAAVLGAAPAAAALHLLVPAQVFLTALGIGVAFVWFDAANFGTLPVLVTRQQLPTASSFISSSGTIALLIGPTAGAVLLTVTSPPIALGLDAASYLISAVLIASIRREFHRAGQPLQPRRRIRSDVGEGLRFLWRQPVIRTMTLAVFCACLSWGGTFSLLVVYASRALHMTRVDARLGLLYTVGELGGLVSVAAIPKLIRHLPVGCVQAGFLAANVAGIALLAIAPSYGWAVAIFCCYELVYVMVTSTGITVRQLLTPDDLQARVNTAGRLIAYGGQPVGSVIGGLLAEFLPIRLTFALLAVGVAAGACLAGWAALGSRPFSAASLPARSLLSEPSAAPVPAPAAAQD